MKVRVAGEALKARPRRGCGSTSEAIPTEQAGAPDDWMEYQDYNYQTLEHALLISKLSPSLLFQVRLKKIEG
jgi:hypothetical protein